MISEQEQIAKEANEVIYLDSISERRRIREELQRTEASGFSVDPADKCKCPHCGRVHYRPRKDQLNENLR